MNLSFEQTLVEVWRQALIENAKVVVLGEERYPVRRTPKRGLRQLDFVFDGNEIRRRNWRCGPARGILLRQVPRQEGRNTKLNIRDLV